LVPLFIGLFWCAVALAGDLSFGYVPVPGPGENPAFLITPARDVAMMWVTIQAGEQSYEFEKNGIAAGEQARFAWRRDPSVTQAKALVTVDFVDGHREEVSVPFQWSYGVALQVDLDRAVADVRARTLTVAVSAPVERADITAYGAHKRVLSKENVAIQGGPGDIAIPWVGSASEVVLLDVTLHSGNSWAGFTYSPWFLDIPHDDVLFETNEATIPASQEHKLEATWEELRDVLDQYGEVVPVKLFIAGCTDTEGDGAHNRDLSRKRARAIASWLRKRGYNRPIYYFGFGESFLAVQTGDGVDSPANRRALYMVGAVPPPASTGVPQVRWLEL
jgi:outer membrane protein OmpA-like peptidoglycan-associated protein